MRELLTPHLRVGYEGRRTRTILGAAAAGFTRDATVADADAASCAGTEDQLQAGSRGTEVEIIGAEAASVQYTIDVDVDIVGACDRAGGHIDVNVGGALSVLEDRKSVV